MVLCVQKNVHSNRFVEYMCLQVVPVLSHIGGSAVTSGVDVQLELIKLLAEMVSFAGELEHNDQCTANVFSKLLVRSTSILGFRLI